MKKFVVLLSLALVIACGSEDDGESAAVMAGSPGNVGATGGVGGEMIAAPAPEPEPNMGGDEAVAGMAGDEATSGMPGDAGSAGDGGMSDATPGDSAISAECEARFAGAADTGACISNADKSALCDVQSNIDEIMQNCALQDCFSVVAQNQPNGELSTCAATCVGNQAGFTNGCAGCFGETLACTMRECFLEAASMNAETLATCVGEKCDDSFYDCAGISLNDR